MVSEWASGGTSIRAFGLIIGVPFVNANVFENCQILPGFP
jgi:hypothetical protein